MEAVVAVEQAAVVEVLEVEVEVDAVVEEDVEVAVGAVDAVVSLPCLRL